MRIRSASTLVGNVTLIATLAACSGSGGGSSPTSSSNEFRLNEVSVASNAVWEINRRIEFEFSLPVDFLSITSNTISIQRADGVPATGSFFLKEVDRDGDGIFESVDETTVVFQPSCPVRPDFSDAGLTPGGARYTITVNGRSSGANTVRSSDSRSLDETLIRSFTTPNSLASGIVFLDTTMGGPIPVVRPQDGTTITNGVTHVEIGGDSDPSRRIYFEFDSSTQTYAVAPGTNAPARIPLNLYSLPESSVVLVLEFNQAVNPAQTNISEKRLRLEYEESNGAWKPIDTRVELVSNCTGSGATVRLEPIGLLPASSRLRAVVLEGFQDIRGEVTTATLSRFAVVPTADIFHAGFENPEEGADEFLEEFNLGAPSVRSFEDATALFDTPPASWKNGKLMAAFDFVGTGGPGGDFDWVVRRDEIFLFDTDRAEIVGGPDGVATTVLNSTSGVVDIRNLIIEEGGVLRVQGPNPIQINATGFVRIDGELNANGFNAKNVATLDTGNQPEVGGAGAAAGGVGGGASARLTTSTEAGGTGGGPFGESRTGGLGGESGYANANLGKDSRRPGGGGGGRFAADHAKLPGLFAQIGAPGHDDSTGAVTRARPAPGGRPGSGPFSDESTDNDFFGAKPVVELDASGRATLSELVRGELPRLWAGYGGGGGGDALPSTRFPTPRWNATSDEKGGGGGGGGGAVRIRALGEIVFGRRGIILARGGGGATGENTFFLDHVGGTGGSGSGGHVLLESGVRIDFTGGNPSTAQSRVHINARGGPRTIGSKARGVPCGISHGGSGGPGVIQLHVPSIQPFSDKTDPNEPTASDIVIPTATLGLALANPLEAITTPPGIHMIPTFGPRSKARSRWISLGGAALDPDGVSDVVSFLFGGTETSAGIDEGKVLTVLEQVSPLPPLLGPAELSSSAQILSDGVTLRISGPSLAPIKQARTASFESSTNDLYLRTPSLLRNFLLRFEQVGNPSNTFGFDVASAKYDSESETLDLTVNDVGVTLSEFANGIEVEFVLVPRFFRVRTGGVSDYLPDTASVRITFEGARDDGFGNPDEGNLLVPKTGDIARFNALQPGELQFFRFEVEFDLDARKEGVSPKTQPTQLDYLRLPFRF